ncbi:MAG: HAMP domain-containing histidine kinase [Alphaproteobacteria bacterium]|nr:HAMP domain-containing histidine kinase [Alphaproteobacteria bacterium]
MSADRPALDLDWLMRVRTGAVLGIAALVGFSGWWLELVLPTGALAALLGVWLVSAVAPSLWGSGRARDDATVAALLALDALLLTGVLYLTGGPQNPFAVVYLVHISLAAAALPPRYAVALAAASTGLYGMLFVAHMPLRSIHDGHPGHDAHDMSTHLRGMWLAYALAAAGITTFTTRVTRALADRERALADARAQALRSERLAGLATLAAGAAHELATPLSTIAIAARELEQELRAVAAPSDAQDDLRLIREQVDRCRGILDQLRAGSGEPGGEAPEEVRLATLVDAALDGLTERARVDLVLGEAADARLTTFPRSLAQALRAVLRNALDASDGAVEVHATTTPDGLRLEVVDHGAGMDDTTLARLGEPFFTTKPTGRGMGLGVFLARAVVERVGGRLAHASTPGTGTRATFTLPRTARST